MLDGAAKVKPMLAEAQRLEMPAIGMTDHGNMFGASEFYNAATDAGIKPIIGIEAYVAPASRFDTKRVLWGDPSQKSDDVSGSGAYTHMTMMAESATGLRNLFKLSSLASFEGQLGKWSRMDAELIAEHAAGIIATTGCPSGEVQTRLRLGHDREALEAAAKWREIFGAENFFLELMDHGLDIERRVREGLLEVGRKLNIPPLATNDCHYVTRDASQNHEALLCIQTGKTLSDPNRFKFDGDGYYLKSAAEMRALWNEFEAWETPEARFAHSVESVLNEMGTEGWEYLRAELLPSDERSGLTGTTTNWRNVLVFRRALSGAVAQPIAPPQSEIAATGLPPARSAPVVALAANKAPPPPTRSLGPAGGAEGTAPPVFASRARLEVAAEEDNTPLTGIEKLMRRNSGRGADTETKESD